MQEQRILLQPKDMFSLVEFNQIRKLRVAAGPGTFPSLMNIASDLKDDEGMTGFDAIETTHLARGSNYNTNLLIQARQLQNQNKRTVFSNVSEFSGCMSANNY